MTWLIVAAYLCTGLVTVYRQWSSDGIRDDPSASDAEAGFFVVCLVLVWPAIWFISALAVLGRKARNG